MAWNRNSQPDETPPVPRKPAGSTKVSNLGPSISLKGDLTGSEDLRVEGSVEGTIRLDKHSVLVSASGRIQADIHGSSICVEGRVRGNLYGEKEVVIRPSGQLEGNITAPSVTLENGAKFRGAIDMEPRSQTKTSSTAANDKKPETSSAASSSHTEKSPSPAAAQG